MEQLSICKTEGWGAQRGTPRPTTQPFEAARPIKLPALSGEPRLPSGEPAAGVGDHSGGKPRPGVARNPPPKPLRGRGHWHQRPRHAIFLHRGRGSGSSQYLLRLADCHSQAGGDDRFGSSQGRSAESDSGRASVDSLVTIGPPGIATPGAARRWDRPTKPAWREGTLQAPRPSTGPWPPERGAADCNRRIRADRSAVCRPPG